MDALTAFGLFAVAAMLVCFASRSTARGSPWLSRALVVSVLFTGFFKAPGHSVWSKPFGRLWPRAAELVQVSRGFRLRAASYAIIVQLPH
jgi:hypothetical protein